MEWVCGSFTPELIPDWISKVGPGLAAIVAVVLYGANRRNARSDLNAKRRVLRSLLVDRMRNVCFHAGQRKKLIGPGNNPLGWPGFAKSGAMSIGSVQHLLELQLELIKVADHGDEAIAEFMEACREYDQSVGVLASFNRDSKDDPNLNYSLIDAMTEAAFMDMTRNLDNVIERAAKAQQQLKM